jgi:hypothetical protein
MIDYILFLTAIGAKFENIKFARHFWVASNIKLVMSKRDYFYGGETAQKCAKKLT